ncbi:MAG TPA: major capsid protein [Allocoleopsis sp.]
MSGAILQLNHRGLQDSYITGNPELNFLHYTYKKHHSFAIQKSNIHANHTVDFGRDFEIEIPKKGDFLHKCYLSFTLPPLVKTSGNYAGWTNSIGHAMIDYIELEIGGLVVDKHYGLYLELLNELSEKRDSHSDKMIGKFNHIQLLETNAESSTTYLVPLKFWFCDLLGSSLPLLALRYCPIKLRVKLRPFSECIVYDGITPPSQVNITDFKLITEYVFIEDHMRELFLGQRHQYLINQCQMNSTNIQSESKIHKPEIVFNGMCYEILFVLREVESENNNDWFNFSKRNTVINTPITPLLSKAKFIVDGIEMIDLQDQSFFSLLNSNRFHYNTTDKHVYMIPFSNEPEKWYQPSGSLNFSTVDFSYIYLEMSNNFQDSNLFIFGKTINMITIHQGTLKLGFTS